MGYQREIKFYLLPYKQRKLPALPPEEVKRAGSHYTDVRTGEAAVPEAQTWTEAVGLSHRGGRGAGRGVDRGKA